ncbi:MAG: DegV family protein [Ruminococcaceae bacterium]|nr:DegV family protein [Oscillospiraceae bacterium]
MSSFVIIPDTSCDLTRDLRERYNIPDYLHGALYYPDGRESLSYLDWEEISPKEYYDSMKGRKALYKTATPLIGEVYEVFEKYLKQGKDILNICLSAGLSSIYESNVAVAKDLMEKYPDRKIICVDSMRYSTSLALLIIEAAKKQAEGLSIEEVADYVNEVKHTIHQIGSMDDLFFLVKTGRVTNFKAFFGQMIGLNILADFNERGMSEVIGKIKGQRDAIDTFIEYMAETAVDIENQTVFVAHTNREAAAKLLADKIKERFNPKEIILTVVGTACGATIGPGLCAAFYKGKPTSKDMVYEKELIAKIIESKKEK